MITKQISWFGRECTLACDARCEKAWGISHRPSRPLSSDPDDYIWLRDSELGEAPADPGTYEGGHGKPWRAEDRLNKWCARECERSKIVERGDKTLLIDFENPGPNMPHRKAVCD